MQACIKKHKPVPSPCLFLSFFVLLLSSCSHNQSTHSEASLWINVENVPAGEKLYVYDDLVGGLMDSTIISGARNKLEFALKQPTRVKLVKADDQNHQSRLFWVEPGSTQIQGNWDTLQEIRVWGGREQNIFAELEKLEADWNAKYQEAVASGHSETIPDLLDQLQNSLLTFSLEHRNSYVGIHKLYQIRNSVEHQKLDSMLQLVEEPYLSSPYGKSLVMHLNTPNVEVGDPYQAIAGINEQGDRISLDNLEKVNKPLILILGGLDCMEKRGRDLLQAFYQQEKERIDVLVFSFARNEREWKKECGYELKVPLITDLLGDHSPAKIKYHVQTTPMVFIIDQQGDIAWKSVGYHPGVNAKALALTEPLDSK